MRWTCYSMRWFFLRCDKKNKLRAKDTNELQVNQEEGIMKNVFTSFSKTAILVIYIDHWSFFSDLHIIRYPVCLFIVSSNCSFNSSTCTNLTGQTQTNFSLLTTQKNETTSSIWSLLILRAIQIWCSLLTEINKVWKWKHGNQDKVPHWNLHWMMQQLRP